MLPSRISNPHLVCQILTLPPARVPSYINRNTCIHLRMVRTNTNNRLNHPRGTPTPAAIHLQRRTTTANNPPMFLLPHLPPSTNPVSTSWRKPPPPSSTTKTRASSKPPLATLPALQPPPTTSWSFNRNRPLPERNPPPKSRPNNPKTTTTRPRRRSTNATIPRPTFPCRAPRHRHPLRHRLQS